MLAFHPKGYENIAMNFDFDIRGIDDIPMLLNDIINL